MKQKILVIDDEVSVCESVSILLSADYDVHYVTSSDALLKWISSHDTLDLVIIDYNIDRQNGVELFEREVVAAYGSIPAILISGYVGQKHQTDEFLKLPELFNATVQKPFDIIQFKQVVDRVVNELPKVS